MKKNWAVVRNGEIVSKHTFLARASLLCNLFVHNGYVIRL